MHYQKSICFLKKDLFILLSCISRQLSYCFTYGIYSSITSTTLYFKHIFAYCALGNFYSLRYLLASNMNLPLSDYSLLYSFEPFFKFIQPEFYYGWSSMRTGIWIIDVLQCFNESFHFYIRQVVIGFHC